MIDVAEKIRAISGQRRYAIARDIYDIHFVSRQNVDIDKSINVLPEKCQIKDIEIRSLQAANFLDRKDEYKKNWERNLEYLILSSMKVDFNKAWDSTVEILNKALK